MSAPVALAMFCATPLVVPVAEKKTTSVLLLDAVPVASAVSVAFVSPYCASAVFASVAVACVAVASVAACVSLADLLPHAAKVNRKTANINSAVTLITLFVFVIIIPPV